MPSLALPAFWGAVSAGASAGAGVYGAHKQSQATNRAADISAQSTTAAIEEQKRQDAINQANFEKTQAAQQAQWDAQQNIRAPYRQAGQAALSSLGDILGVSFGGGGGNGGGGSAPSQAGNPSLLPKAGEVNWMAPPDQLAGQLSAYFKSRGVDDSEVPYWVSKAPELVARGKELNDPSYADKWLPRAEVFGKGGAPASVGNMPRRMPLAPTIIAPTGNATAATYSPVIPFNQIVRT